MHPLLLLSKQKKLQVSIVDQLVVHSSQINQGYAGYVTEFLYSVPNLSYVNYLLKTMFGRCRNGMGIMVQVSLIQCS